MRAPDRTRPGPPEPRSSTLSSVPASRPCSKSRCNAPATATFRFDYDASTVWLESLPPDPADAGYVLCDSHAEVFTAPVGWTVHDTRARTIAATRGRRPRRGRMEAIDTDHPAVRSRSRHLEIRPRSEGASAPHAPAPLEEHPSGPLDLGARDEPPEVTRELNRLARHLVLDADTDPGAGVPPGLFAARLDATATSPPTPRADAAPDREHRPSRQIEPDAHSETHMGAAANIDAGPRADADPVPGSNAETQAELDDDSTFGDEPGGDDHTEQISRADLEAAARAYLEAEESRYDPPHFRRDRP